MSDSVVPRPTHSGFAAKLLVRATGKLAVSQAGGGGVGARQVKDASTDIVAVIDEPYDPSPDALLAM